MGDEAKLIEIYDVPARKGARDYSEIISMLRKAYSEGKAVRASARDLHTYKVAAFRLLKEMDWPNGIDVRAHQRNGYAYIWFEKKG